MFLKILFGNLYLCSLCLLAIAIASCGQPTGSVSSIKAEDKPTSLPVSQLQGIENKSEPSNFSEQGKSEPSNFSKQKKLVDPIPVPNAQGDYTVQKRRLLHPLWLVVDPEGVNCRMPQQFHGQSLSTRATENLLRDNEHDILQWSVMTVIKTGEVVHAFGGNLGALILVKDRQGKIWLPVAMKQGNLLGNCFVRANQNFIKPVSAEQYQPQASAFTKEQLASLKSLDVPIVVPSYLPDGFKKAFKN